MGKVQSDKTEKVISFSCGGVKPLRGGIPTPKDYESHFKELNIAKFGEFMFGIRFAFEFFGYKAIPMDKGKYNDVYQRAIFKLIMENNINLQDFITGVKEIEFYDHKQDKKGRLIDVKARFMPLARAHTRAHA